MSKFGPQPDPDPDHAVQFRVNKAVRNGTCRLENMKLVEVPRSLLDLDVSKQMQASRPDPPPPPTPRLSLTIELGSVSTFLTRRHQGSLHGTKTSRMGALRIGSGRYLNVDGVGILRGMVSELGSKRWIR